MQTPAPLPPPSNVSTLPTPPRPQELNALLGKGSQFDGKLLFEGTVRIDGNFKGEIFTDGVLVIGEGAEVQAEIDVATVIIEGSVRGNVRAKQLVEIHAPGRVAGNLVTPSLFIDKGVVFEGNCHMDELGAPGRAHGA